MMSNGDKETSVLTSGVEDFCCKGRIDRKCWKNVRLGDCATLFAGGTPNRSHSDYYGGDIPWCSISDISGSGKFLVHTAESLTSLGIENSSAKVIPADSILFAMYASIGECTLATTPLTTSQAILGIYSLKGFDREYLYYYFCSQKKAFMNQGQTGTQSNLSKEIISNILLPQPDIKEQLRIANSLSLIDANIAAIQNLIHKYEAIKKSTVNLLLKPKTGWNKIGLRHFELHRNNTCSRSLTSGISGKTRNIHYGDILVKFGEIVSLKHDHIDYLSEVGEAHSPKDYLQDGDIVMADTAEDETVGKVVEIQNVGNQKAVAGLHTFFLRPPTDFFARRWLGYWMNSRFYHDQLLPYMTGIKVLSLSKSSILNTEISYPSRVEQEQTVEVLQSIDNHITLLHTQAVKAQQLKQGMMSYFFG